VIVPCERCRGEGEIVRTPCRQCRGERLVRQRDTITVNIPPGIEDETALLLRGEGDSGLRGGRNGDLHVVVRIAPHPRFKRRNPHDHMQVAVAPAAQSRIALPTQQQRGFVFDSWGDVHGDCVALAHEPLATTLAAWGADDFAFAAAAFTGHNARDCAQDSGLREAHTP
jgi:molecular chaperone DnaJ